MYDDVDFNDLDSFINSCKKFIKNYEELSENIIVGANMYKVNMLALMYSWTPTDGLHYKHMGYPYESTKQYLNTWYWQTIKTYVIFRRGNQCEECKKDGNNPAPLEVHHSEYRYVGEEHLHTKTALRVLCQECHCAIHSAGDNRKLSNSDFW